MQVLYLGISGVLHPSASKYELVERRSPWADGHAEYEAVPWLAQTLERFPAVQIVLTSTQPRQHGLDKVKEQLGPALSARVVAYTFEDLTTKRMRPVQPQDGRRRAAEYSADDYWRMNKSDIVAAHVDWLGPSAWVAVDDEDILWPSRLREHVVIVDGCKGLLDLAAQDRLVTVFTGNFSDSHCDQ